MHFKVCGQSITRASWGKKLFQEQEKHLLGSLGSNKILQNPINQGGKSSDRSFQLQCKEVTSQKLLSLSNVIKQHQPRFKVLFQDEAFNLCYIPAAWVIYREVGWLLWFDMNTLCDFIWLLFNLTKNEHSSTHFCFQLRLKITDLNNGSVKLYLRFICDI